ACVDQTGRGLGDSHEQGVEFQALTDGDDGLQQGTDTFLGRRDPTHPRTDLVQQVIQSNLWQGQAFVFGAIAVRVTHGGSFPAVDEDLNQILWRFFGHLSPAVTRPPCEWSQRWDRRLFRRRQEPLDSNHRVHRSPFHGGSLLRDSTFSGSRCLMSLPYQEPRCPGERPTPPLWSSSRQERCCGPVPEVP